MKPNNSYISSLTGTLIYVVGIDSLGRYIAVSSSLKPFYISSSVKKFYTYSTKNVPKDVFKEAQTKYPEYFL